MVMMFREFILNDDLFFKLSKTLRTKGPLILNFCKKPELSF
jgi:hypothetical protein